MPVFLNLLRVIVPLVVLGGAGYWAYTKATNPKEAQRGRKGPKKELIVEAIRVQKSDFDVVVRTRGSVRPRTESTLISEVTGRIVDISPSFRDGKFFEKDEVLLEIDKLDYKTAVVVAKSELAQAKAALEEEKSKAAQALETWKRLGREGEPSDLNLRKPQLAEAEAREAAAQSRLAKAERDLERTDIKAPYAGRILRKEVDQGQVVSQGANLARIFAVDFAEIRLPLTDRQAGFIKLPERYRGEDDDRKIPFPEVTLSGLVGGSLETWKGEIVRVEGAIDQTSRQLFVVAQVEDPYGKKNAGKPPLRVNLFVEAEIKGRVLNDVIELPRAVVRADDEVIVIDGDNRLQRRKIAPIWDDEDSVVVEVGVSQTEPEIPGDPPVIVGLEQGDLVCATPIPFAANGVEVVTRVRGDPQPLTGKPGDRPRGAGSGDGKDDGNGKGDGDSVRGEVGGAKEVRDEAGAGRVGSPVAPDAEAGSPGGS